MLSKIITLVKTHILLTAVAVVALAGGGYYAYHRFAKAAAPVRYVTAAAEKGTLVSTVSGSGSVSASDQISLQPKASGDLTYLGVTAGQEVKAGTVIARIDARAAVQAVKDAQDGLDTANLSMEKLTAPADAFTIQQDQHALEQAQNAKTQAEDNIKKGYQDGFSSVTNVFLDLPAVMTELQDTLYSTSLVSTQSNIDYYADSAYRYDAQAYALRDEVMTKYQNARAAYDASFTAYKATSRFADDAEVEHLINASYATAETIADSLKSTEDFIQFYKDKLVERNIKTPSGVDTHLSALSSDLGKVNSQSSNLLSVLRSLDSNQQALKDAAWTISERQNALDTLQKGADSFDIRSQNLTIAQRKNALTDAQRKLADYSVVAPFDGVIADVKVAKGQSVSSGTVIGTLITHQQIATITLNEVDVAKVAVGQKATLTFDAIPDLSISGQVAEVDAIGTSSQGVVNYGVKISFDTQDARVKPAMSVTTTVIIEAKPDVLLVPASAVKNQGGSSYVDVMPPGSTDAPVQRDVTIGATNDESVEILSGLEAGENVVTRTITPTATPAAASTTSSSTLRGLTGGGAVQFGGGGGGARGGVGR